MNQQIGTTLITTQQPREGEGTSLSGSTGDPPDSGLMRSPTLPLRNDFNLLSVEQVDSDMAGTNNIALGAHLIWSDD